MSSNTSDEGQIDKLERELPVASGMVFTDAYNQALQAGLSVLVSDDGAIYEVFPDGRRRLVKRISPPTATQPGLKIIFR